MNCADDLTGAQDRLVPLLDEARAAGDVSAITYAITYAISHLLHLHRPAS